MGMTDPSAEPELQPPVQVPIEALSEQALAGIIDDFILREGTDYGHQETGYDAKTRRVRAQLDSGEVVIAFDPNTESVTLMTQLEWKKRTRS
jgi:uncharacterized protein YheU (UPF0270 family)